MQHPSTEISELHDGAFVHPTVVLGRNVSIGPCSRVGAGVTLGDGCVLDSYSVIHPGTVLGEGVHVDSFAVIGGDPQFTGFDSAIQSGVLIGEGTRVRESVTINRSIHPGENTSIGAHAYLMAGSHIGHDCQVGDHVILANNVMLAGHVVVDAYCFVGGGAGVHQFVRIGESAMIGGNASISRDVPPFTIVAERNELFGLNTVGLRRRTFSAEHIAILKNCFRAVYGSLGDLRLRAEAAWASMEVNELGDKFLHFFENGQRGFATLRRRDRQTNGSRASS